MKKFIDIQDCVSRGPREMAAATIRLDNGREYEVRFVGQRTGYGEKKFFICPRCGSRRTKLYLYGNWLLCRSCYPGEFYRTIKNVTPGGDLYIAHLMRSLARKEQIELQRVPFCYLEYRKPKYRHFKKWHTAIVKLQALENMRNQAIFFNKRYPLDVIRGVLKGENALLYVCTLQELDQYFYNWEDGSRIYNRFPEYFLKRQ